MSSRFIECNQCTTLVGDADNRVGFVCLGAGEIWQISETSSQFCCESQTSLKNIKPLKKKIISKRVHVSLHLG